MNRPTIHFRTPGTDTAPCNPYTIVVTVNDQRQVTCRNCQRTWVYKNHLKKVAA